LSTLPSQARLSPDWKEEVNQRIAAHKNRKPAPVVGQDDASTQEHHASSTRAAAAAARVAARFAKAPSYNELLENEARAAVRAAEAVSRAALQAQAVAESVLAELQAAKSAEPDWQFSDDDAPVQSHSDSSTVDVDELEAQPAGQGARKQNDWERPANGSQSYQVRWEPDAPMTYPDTSAPGARVESADWQGGARFENEQEIEIVEGAQPIHANLIQFPREIVATRKVRPRRAEGPFAEPLEPGSQLSIFEVDPEAISTDPAAADAMNPASAPTWMCPEWYGMELDNHPEGQLQANTEAETSQRDVPVTIVDHRIEQAPLTARLMAAVVDGSLALAVFLAFTTEILSHMHTMPAMRTAELAGAIGLALTSALYIALFYYLSSGTPGMMYARIALSTFEGGVPTRDERLQRCVALLLSVLPVGVGVLWSIFDEDHLSWHDRLSRTYLRSH
jgi:uncharacterized RDD family membrane protein YckC